MMQRIYVRTMYSTVVPHLKKCLHPYLHFSSLLELLSSGAKYRVHPLISTVNCKHSEGNERTDKVVRSGPYYRILERERDPVLPGSLRFVEAAVLEGEGEGKKSGASPPAWITTPTINLIATRTGLVLLVARFTSQQNSPAIGAGLTHTKKD